MRRFTAVLSLCYALLTWAASANAQIAPNRDSAEYYFQRGASFYGVPGANKAVMDTLRRKAVADYTKSISFDSSYYWSYRNRGYCHQNSGEYELALADYERAMRTSRRVGHENVDYLHSRCAAMCMSLEKWAAAEAHCSAFLAMPGYDSLYYHSAWRNRAETRVRLQKYAVAQQDYLVYQRQTVAELLAEEKNLIEIQEHAVNQDDLKHLPKRDRAMTLARYEKYLVEQVTTVDKLRTEMTSTAAKIAELENLIR